MGSIFDKLCSDQLIRDYPSHMKNNVQYECIMGSTAYGVSDNTSDIDVYGFTMPPKHILFPYSDGGYIVGFGSKPENFKQFQKHHITDKTNNKEYDISIYNIVKFFNLCMENNPNMVDALFVPTRCVLHCTDIGNRVRENRKLFLSKRVWHKFKGYAFSQLHKMKNKNIKIFVEHCKKYNIPFDAPFDVVLQPLRSDENDELRMASVISKIETNGKRSKRISIIAEHGYDTKFAYHVVRLIDECHMILEEGDLDLTRSREHLKAIRRGEWSMEKVEEYFDTKMINLEELYSKSTLRYSPDEDAIKYLLLECIEAHYGKVENVSNNDSQILMLLGQAEDSIDRVRKLL